MRKRFLKAIAAILIILMFNVSSAEADQRDEEIAELKRQVQKLLTRIEALEREQAKTKEAISKKEEPTLDLGQRVCAAEDTNELDLLPNYLIRGFEFNGYFRSGFGINNEGGKMEAFQAPGAPVKYRLGNEQDTYLETVFTEKNWNPDPDGLKLLTRVRVAYQTQQNQDWDTTNDIALREVYAQMSNFAENDPDMKVWGGKRFYRLPSLVINDFFWSDMSGYGGGLKDISFFDIGKLNIAYIGYASTDITISTNNGRIAKNNLHVMLDEMEVPGGKGTFWVNGGFMPQGDYEGQSYPDAAGLDVGVMHQAHVGGICNQLGLQYGYSACSSLSTGADIPMTGNDKDSWRFRLTDMYDQKFSDRLSIQAVGVYQYTDNGKDEDYQEHWMSFGVRPVYGLTKYLALELEPGIDYVNNEAYGYDSCLLKVTSALRISPSAAFDGHPRFRLFATYAHWADDFKGHVGGDAFANERDGFNFGVQGEHWW